MSYYKDPQRYQRRAGGAPRNNSRAGRAELHRAILLVVIAVTACANPPAETPPPSLSSSELLDEIGRAFWQYELDDQILSRMWQGTETISLPDLSPEHAEYRSARARELLDRLRGVDPEDLSHDEWVAFETLRWDLGIYAEVADHYWLAFPVTPYAMAELGVHTLFQSLSVETPADAERYLDLVRLYPAFVDAIRAKLEAQKERGIVLPAPEIDLILPAWEARLAAPEMVFSAAGEAASEGGGQTESPPGGGQTEYVAAELAGLFDTQVKPAWERLIELLKGEYRDAAPRAVGLGQYPGGAAYYDLLIRWNVGMEALPADVHRLGLERIAATNARMDEVRRRLGFDGTRAELHRSLRSDPRFFAKTPEEVGERLLAYVALAEPKIDEYFTRRPSSPYGVERLSPDLEAISTYGHFQFPTEDDPRGVYVFNGSKLGERSLINAQSLIYHELIPGHHFQLALLFENDELPDYRRGNWHGGHVEGWADYASSVVATEMGLYQDPYDLYGRLSDDNFFAARLVVDTGMNVLGWSRERAIELMLESTLESSVQIETETLRYSVGVPAQSLGYALGSLKILELRERARQALGERFDNRRFHDAVLGYGSMPLAVLDQHIDWFIEQESR